MTGMTNCLNYKNDCKNIQKVFNYYIDYDERLERYRIWVDLQKTTNHNSVIKF